MGGAPPSELPVGISIGADALGASADLDVDLTVYPLTAVLKTAYWFTDRFFLYLHRPEGVLDRVLVEIRSKERGVGRDALIEACSDFANGLVDQAVRQLVLAETSGVRDALVRKAFGEGRTHGDPDAFADPRAVAAAGTFDSDPQGIRRAEDGHAAAG